MPEIENLNFIMNKIAASELIINNRGAVYHVNCRPEEIDDEL